MQITETLKGLEEWQDADAELLNHDNVDTRLYKFTSATDADGNVAVSLFSKTTVHSILVDHFASTQPDSKLSQGFIWPSKIQIRESELDQQKQEELAKALYLHTQELGTRFRKTMKWQNSDGIATDLDISN